MNDQLNIELDHEYLSHKFKYLLNGNNFNNYLCQKCNYKIFKYKEGTLFNSAAEAEYWLISNVEYPIVLNLTCDEIIIKNIIE